MSILPKLVYRFSAISKPSRLFFCFGKSVEINKLSQKVLYVNTYVIYLVICKCKRPGIARTTLKNKNKIGEHMLPGFKTYKSIVIKIVRCWYKNRQINQ